MAGVTASGLASLREPEEYLYDASARQRPSLAVRLGLAPTVSLLNIVGLISTAFLSVAWLVSLNSLQAFVLTDVLDIPSSRVGRVSGSLILADEFLALAFVVLWGALIDRVGPRFVACVGHFVVAISFLIYPRCRTAFPSLLLARLLFSVGASALVTILSALLSRYTAVNGGGTTATSPVDEQTPLLPGDSGSTQTPSKAGRFSGILGFSTGCGALFAVFVILRLPVALSKGSDTSADGIRQTFELLSALALLECFFLLFALRSRSNRDGGEAREQLSVKAHVSQAIKELPVGFRLALHHGDIALSCYSAFTTRAQAVMVTAFIPVLINKFFREHDLCRTIAQVVGLAKEGECRRAIILSSSLTGTVQLISLLASPAIGWASARFSEISTLAACSLAGAISFLLFGLIPNGDPRSPLVWVAAIGMGVSQISGIVISLTIVAKARGTVMANEGVERAGSIAGVYSMAGGLGILITSQIGGALLDVWSGSPFVLIAALQAVLVLASFAYLRRHKSRQ